MVGGSTVNRCLWPPIIIVITDCHCSIYFVNSYNSWFIKLLKFNIKIPICVASCFNSPKGWAQDKDWDKVAHTQTNNSAWQCCHWPKNWYLVFCYMLWCFFIHSDVFQDMLEAKAGDPQGQAKSNTYCNTIKISRQFAKNTYWMTNQIRGG